MEIHTELLLSSLSCFASPPYTNNLTLVGFKAFFIMTYFFSGILPSLEMYLAGKKHLVFLVVKRKGRVWKNLLVLSDMKTQNVCDGFRRWSWTSRFNVTSLEMINGRIQVGVAVASRPTSWLERVLPRVSCVSCVAFGKLLIKLTFSVNVFLKKVLHNLYRYHVHWSLWDLPRPAASILESTYWQMHTFVTFNVFKPCHIYCFLAEARLLAT